MEHTTDNFSNRCNFRLQTKLHFKIGHIGLLEIVPLCSHDPICSANL